MKRFLKAISFIFLIISCSTFPERSITVPSWFIEGELENKRGFITARGVSENSWEESIEKAKKNALNHVSNYIYIHHLGKPDTVENYRKILIKEIDSILYRKMKVIKQDSCNGIFYTAVGMKMKGLDRVIEKGFDVFNKRKFIMLEDTEGNLLKVWFTESRILPNTKEVLGIYGGINPQNPGYFTVDVEPCLESGLVSIPGKVIKVERIGDKECSKGKNFTLYKIIYREGENE